jgi:coenzyme F420-0:L-glutamate ligase/coenzyme F420-1:gamma-L-glutamate ligase
VIRDFPFGDHEGSDRLFRDVEEDLVREALGRWEYEVPDADSASEATEEPEEPT